MCMALVQYEDSSHSQQLAISNSTQGRQHKTGTEMEGTEAIGRTMQVVWLYVQFQYCSEGRHGPGGADAIALGL